MGVGTGVGVGISVTFGVGVSAALRGKNFVQPQSSNAMSNARDRMMLFFLLGRIPLAYQFWYGYNRGSRNFPADGINAKNRPERSSP